MKMVNLAIDRLINKTAPKATAEAGSMRDGCQEWLSCPGWQAWRPSLRTGRALCC